MYKYFKTKLHNLSYDQKKFIHDSASVYRWCYNWGLEYCNKERKKGNSNPSWYTLNKAFGELRNSNKYPWLKEYDLSTCRNALKDLKNAFNKFFSNPKYFRYPKFKSKKRSKVSFHTRDEKVTFWGENNRYVRIPGTGHNKSMLMDCKNHKIPIGDDIKYYNTRISFDGINYWISGSYEIKEELPDPPKIIENIIGIDVGYKTAAMISNGDSYDIPDKAKSKIKSLVKRSDKLRKSISNTILGYNNKAISTRTKYEDIPKSKNYKKRLNKYIKLNHKIHNIFDYSFHCISKYISELDIDAIVIEDLSISKLKNRHQLNNFIRRVPLYDFTDKIKYKCENNGIKVIHADKDFSSTKLCSNCGYIQDIHTSRIYKCPCCGLVIDRDLNAAINLRNFGLEQCSLT